MKHQFLNIELLNFAESRQRVDLTSWTFTEVEKLPEPMRSPILKDIGEVIGESIFSSTSLELNTSGVENGHKIVFSVGVPLGTAELEDVYGVVAFDKVVEAFLAECDDDMLIPVAEQMEAAARRIRAATKVDEARGEIEHYASGPNLVARLVIDGAQHDAPLTKVDGGYEVTIPTAGVLKLPVKIEQRKE